MTTNSDHIPEARKMVWEHGPTLQISPELTIEVSNAMAKILSVHKKHLETLMKHLREVHFCTCDFGGKDSSGA